jgi:hypothetical protein
VVHPTDARRLAGSGPRPAGMGGMVRPCLAAGPHRGGGGADRWATTTVPGLKKFQNNPNLIQTHPNLR